MILVTGGAGFIGSNLQAALVRRGHETVIADHLGRGGKWRNLARHPPARIIPPGEIDAFLASHPPLEFVYHLGAISDTTATDGDAVWRANFEQSRRIWDWCADREVRLAYASSAATYGDGGQGFNDDGTPDGLARLRPLNLYGWSKHAFDISVARAVAASQPRPPQWVGLKFFNVYGPNEYHKGHMVSVIKVKHDEVAADGVARLFRSTVTGIADGEQKRDFVWVGDAVDVMLWLLEQPDVSGLYNLGTGHARSYLDMAHAVCDAMNAPRQVTFIDMPDALHEQYQSFTEATTSRLRAAGYRREFTPLEAGVRRYVQDHLSQTDPYV